MTHSRRSRPGRSRDVVMLTTRGGSTTVGSGLPPTSWQPRSGFQLFGFRRGGFPGSAFILRDRNELLRALRDDVVWNADRNVSRHVRTRPSTGFAGQRLTGILGQRADVSDCGWWQNRRLRCPCLSRIYLRSWSWPSSRVRRRASLTVRACPGLGSLRRRRRARTRAASSNNRVTGARLVARPVGRWQRGTIARLRRAMTRGPQPAGVP